MYRVSRVLNNNGVIAIDMEDNQEYVLLGKGLGFGKKVSERFEKPEGASMYRLADDLREKMNDSSEKPKYIKTVWGVGYKIE